MSVSRALAIWALLSVIGCKDKPGAHPPPHAERRAEEAKEVEAELARQPEVPPVPLAAPEQAARPSAAQLPVPEDFQPETAATIMRANYLGELEKLETEVRADEN